MATRSEIEAFIARAAEVRLPDAFNPYADTCPVHDLADAAEIRRGNLRAILERVGKEPVDELWLALEPTRKGARRTGLAMTDGRNLAAHAARWGAIGVRPAVRTKDPAEATAAHVWKALSPLKERIFLWNAVFLHTHEPDDMLADRNQTGPERNLCLPVLKQLLAMLRPKQCVAIGINAQEALDSAKRPSIRVRHPSSGGQNMFASEIADLHRAARG